jgi:hypothetical protein
MRAATSPKLTAVFVLLLFVLALGSSTKADSCLQGNCQDLIVLETLTHFTTPGAPTTVEWLFLTSPNFEVIDTWQGGMFDNATLSGSVNIGVPTSINLASLFSFTDTNSGIICCSSCPPGTPVTLEPAFGTIGGPDVPACFDPHVNVYQAILSSGTFVSAGLVDSYIPETPGTFIRPPVSTPEPGIFLMLATGLAGLAFGSFYKARRRYVPN